MTDTALYLRMGILFDPEESYIPHPHLSEITSARLPNETLTEPWTWVRYFQYTLMVNHTLRVPLWGSALGRASAVALPAASSMVAVY